MDTERMRFIRIDCDMENEVDIPINDKSIIVTSQYIGSRNMCNAEGIRLREEKAIQQGQDFLKANPTFGDTVYDATGELNEIAATKAATKRKSTKSSVAKSSTKSKSAKSSVAKSSTPSMMNYIVTSSNGKNKKNSRTNSAKSAGTNNAKSAIQYKKMTGKKDDPKLTTFFQAKGSTSAKSVSVKRSSSNEGVINLTNDSPMKPASKKSKHKAFKQASSKE